MRRLTAEDYAVDAVTAYPPSEASAGGGSTRGAKALVGAWLCRRLDDGTVVRRRITETEAYCGEEDTACHAHKGRTARTDVMYASKRDQNRKWRFTCKTTARPAAASERSR